LDWELWLLPSNWIVAHFTLKFEFDLAWIVSNTIGNENPHPINIDSRMRSIRMTSRSQLFFNKLFFASSENQEMKIIPPTHNKCGKRSLLIWKLPKPYIYVFIYTDSRLKQTLINPLYGLIWGPLIIKPKQYK
jgi:hypothetical protein